MMGSGVRVPQSALRESLAHLRGLFVLEGDVETSSAAPESARRARLWATSHFQRAPGERYESARRRRVRRIPELGDDVRVGRQGHRLTWPSWAAMSTTEWRPSWDQQRGEGVAQVVGARGTSMPARLRGRPRTRACASCASPWSRHGPPPPRRETLYVEPGGARPPIDHSREVAGRLGQEIDRARRPAGLLPFQFPVDEHLLDQDMCRAHVAPLQRKRFLRAADRRTRARRRAWRRRAGPARAGLIGPPRRREGGNGLTARRRSGRGLRTALTGLPWMRSHSTARWRMPWGIARALRIGVRAHAFGRSSSVLEGDDDLRAEVPAAGSRRGEAGRAWCHDAA